MRMYMSKEGDDVQTIAVKKNVSLSSLLHVNPGLSMRGTLRAGTKVHIPTSQLLISNEDEESGRDREVEVESGRGRDSEPETSQGYRRDDVEEFSRRHSRTDFDDYFAPYYEYQKKWLEQWRRHHAMYQYECNPWNNYAQHDQHREHRDELEESEERKHDERNERDEHVKPKRKLKKKRKKKRMKWGGRSRFRAIREEREPQTESQDDERCQEPSELPWLNV